MSDALIPRFVAIVCTLALQLDGDPVVSRGLAHDSKDRALVASAVQLSNLLLASTTFRLVPSWKESESSAAGLTSIPVYAIRTQSSLYSTPAVVPEGCQCVFVDSESFHSWIHTHSMGTARFEFESDAMLAFMLLHEVGHIAGKTAGAHIAGGVSNQLNIAPSRAKADEEAADDFAATRIREARSAGPSATSMAALDIANQVGDLAWNLSAERLLDHFGSTAVGDPAVFFDDGYSHPNLELRVLHSNHLIMQTEASRELLESFERARRTGAARGPIYRAPE